MKLILVTLLVTAGLTLGGTSRATAQEEGFFHSPVFVAQPGIIHSFSRGAPTEFNARFVTAIPLAIDRTTLVGIIQWTPFADNAAGGKANAPAFVRLAQRNRGSPAIPPFTRFGRILRTICRHSLGALP